MSAAVCRLRPFSRWRQTKRTSASESARGRVAQQNGAAVGRRIKLGVRRELVGQRVKVVDEALELRGDVGWICVMLSETGVLVADSSDTLTPGMMPVS